MHYQQYLMVNVAAVAIVATMAGGSAASAQQAPSSTKQAQEVLTGANGKAKSAKSNKKVGAKKASAASTKSATAASADPQVGNDSGRLEGDIIVTGLRENVKTARSAKRRAQQIVDVVLAQDIGKLPDKNVAEALARVPGIQIDRERGEGGVVKIRGLTGVMTTVNGSPSFSGESRSTDLGDISSDLVAAIEVYKTRTPDQVEGSATGVINLTLRRPTDFKEGATYAVSARGDYADQIGQVNPYYSALVAFNANTDAGTFGFSVNGTYNSVRYNEAIRWNDVPNRPGDPRQVIGDGTQRRDIFLPRQVGFSGKNGWSKRAAFQLSTQWKPTNELGLTIEGGYADQKSLWADNQYDLPLIFSGSSVAPPRLSNIVVAPDGRSVRSLTVDSLDPQGPGRQSWLRRTRSYNGRVQVDYRDERVEFNGWVNYARSDRDDDNIFHWIRFNEQPSLDVVFNTPSDPKGGVDITFKNINLLDPNIYRYIDGFNQGRVFQRSREVEIKGDLRLNTDVHLIDYLKFGARFADRTFMVRRGSRELRDLRLPISALPDYELSEIGRGFRGSNAASNANWLMGDSDAIRRNWNAFRACLTPVLPSLSTYYPVDNPLATFRGPERNLAAYGMAHYNLHLLFPIEGIVGARILNALTSFTALSRTTESVIVDGRRTNVVTEELRTSNGNFLSVLPSANAIMHFTPKLQLRASWTYDVQRPGTGDLNPQIVINETNPAVPTATGGNANLRASTLNKYDASLEWYFGTTGTASIAVWEWRQDGLIARRTQPEFFNGPDSIPVLVNRPQNLGRGRHRGIEGQLTGFFTFLPGILKSFGGSVNGTLNITKQAYPTFNAAGEASYVYGPYVNVSKYVYNLTGFFERDGLNIRVAYNWRSRQQQQRDRNNPYLNAFLDPVERLDASINYDINKHLTLALEASNLTRNGERSFWGTYEYPRDVRYFSRNYSVSLRSRF